MTTAPSTSPNPARPAPDPWDEALRSRRAGRLEESLRALSRIVVTSGPLTAAARRLRASVQRDLGIAARLCGDIERAESWIGRGLEDAPEYPDLHFERGLLWLERGRLDDARASFQDALDRAPSFTAASLEIALLDARSGRLGEAVAALRRLADTRPPADQRLFQAGLERMRSGSWEAGSEQLRGAYRVHETAWRQGSLRVGQRLDEGRAPEALDEACRLAERFPHFPDAHLAVGLCCLSLEWWDDAGEACLRALERNPAYHEARIYLACALFEVGESRLAEEELTRVLRCSPGHEWAARLLTDRRAGLEAILSLRPAPLHFA